MSFANIVNTARNEAFERLQGLTLPILAIWGAEDTWVPLNELDKPDRPAPPHQRPDHPRRRPLPHGNPHGAVRGNIAAMAGV